MFESTILATLIAIRVVPSVGVEVIYEIPNLPRDFCFFMAIGMHREMAEREAKAKERIFQNYHFLCKIEEKPKRD